MKQAVVFLRGIKAGILTEDENGYTFEYDADYLATADAEAVSLTLPMSDKPYRDKVLFPFFDGLIPEGWLLDVALRNTDISILDRMHNACVPMINLASFNIDGTHPLLADAAYLHY